MKALALVDAPDHVCCRYRLRGFEPALAKAGWSLTLQGIEKGVFGRLAQLGRVAEYDAVVLQRKLLPSWQFHVLRRRAKRLIFDFDDAVLHRDSYDPRGLHSRQRAARFATTVSRVDTVLAGNDFLADCALRAGARPESVQVIPTCVDTARYPVLTKDKPQSGGLDLVWIGSSSTLQGLEAQRALWERIGREVPGVRLRLICDRFPRFEPLPVVEVPWAGATEAAALAEGDVGISWVPDDLWSRGKCGLKILQYQAAGLPVIANPVGVHPEMIEAGVSGFLPSGPDEWVEAVRTLRDDPRLRERMSAAARVSVRAGYSLNVWSETFVASIAEPGRSGFSPSANHNSSALRGLVRQKPAAGSRRSPRDARVDAP